MSNSNGSDFITRISNKCGYIDFANLSYENCVYCGNNKENFLKNLKDGFGNFALYCYRCYLESVPRPIEISKELSEFIYENINDLEVFNINVYNPSNTDINWVLAKIVSDEGRISLSKDGKYFYHGRIPVFSFTEKIYMQKISLKILYYDKYNNQIGKEYLSKKQYDYLYHWLQKDYLAFSSLKNPFSREFIARFNDEEMVGRQTKLALADIALKNKI